MGKGAATVCLWSCGVLAVICVVALVKSERPKPQEEVFDEILEGSFPASDPPPFSGAHA
jgi:hypothetical protein